MTQVAERLKHACDALGLRMESPSKVTLANGGVVFATALIGQLGGARGMLVFGDFADIEESVDAIVERGYGFTVLPETSRTEEFDLASYVRMFVDWGWAGAQEDIPNWWTSSDSERCEGH